MISLKDLKSIFIVEDENSNKTPVEQPKKENPITENTTIEPQINQQRITIIDPTGGKGENNEGKKIPPPLPNTQNTTIINNTNIPTMENSGIVDKRVFDKLMNVIQSNNVEGFDYLEFKNAIKALANLPLDESTMFKSAFATATTMGLTVDKLTQSIGYYKSLLNKELQTFDEQVRQQMDERVVAKEKEKIMLEKTVAEKQTQIQKLQQEIAQHQQQLSQIQNQATDMKAKIEETRNNFKATHEHLIGLFDTDLQKINTYLK